jgi:hypothetical protein
MSNEQQQKHVMEAKRHRSAPIVDASTAKELGRAINEDCHFICSPE